MIARFVKNVENEISLHRRMADYFYSQVLTLNLERLGEGAQRWLFDRVITDEQGRALSEVLNPPNPTCASLTIHEALVSLALNPQPGCIPRREGSYDRRSQGTSLLAPLPRDEDYVWTAGRAARGLPSLHRTNADYQRDSGDTADFRILRFCA